MNIQLERSNLINILQEINDITIINKVKNFVMLEIEPMNLTINQKKELDKRLLSHSKNLNDGIEGFSFLDNLKIKYEL